MAAGEAVELSQLQIPHLENLRSQLEEVSIQCFLQLNFTIWMHFKQMIRFTQEVKLLGDSMSQLKIAQQKFGDSKENVKKLINKESGELQSFTILKRRILFCLLPVLNDFLQIYSTGKPILVPLTSSVSFDPRIIVLSLSKSCLQRQFFSQFH